MDFGLFKFIFLDNKDKRILYGPLYLPEGGIALNGIMKVSLFRKEKFGENFEGLQRGSN